MIGSRTTPPARATARRRTTRSPAARFTAALVGLSLFGSITLQAPHASAEVGTEEPAAIGKGVVGGALLLSETVMVVEAALGVQPWWAYAIGGGLGAVGGGIGGYFIADADTGAAPMALLTAGLVLAVPTAIAVLSATAYQPPPEDGKVDMTTAYKLAPPNAVATLRGPRPSALVGYGEEGLALQVPAISLAEVYSAKMRLTYALPSETEVRVPMIDVQF